MNRTLLSSSETSIFPKSCRKLPISASEEGLLPPHFERAEAIVRAGMNNYPKHALQEHPQAGYLVAKLLLQVHRCTLHLRAPHGQRDDGWRGAKCSSYSGGLDDQNSPGTVPSARPKNSSPAKKFRSPTHVSQITPPLVLSPQNGPAETKPAPSDRISPAPLPRSRRFSHGKITTGCNIQSQ